MDNVTNTENSEDLEDGEELENIEGNEDPSGNIAKPRDLMIWFAGFYEGEGTICNDISNNNRIKISLSQNDRTPLDMASKIWGGTVRERNRTSDKGKDCHGHEWGISHTKSLEFINDIRPFMHIPYKIQQMEAVIAQSHVPLDRRFKCNYCDLDYASPAGRRRHERTKHPLEIQAKIHQEKDEGEQSTAPPNQRYKCHYCHLAYATPAGRHNHERLKHSSEINNVQP